MNNRSLLTGIGMVLVIVLVGSVLLGMASGIFSRAAPSSWEDLGDFTRISMAAVGDMRIMQGESAVLTVDAAPRDLERLHVYTQGDTLYVEYRRGWFAWGGTPEQRIRYTVTLPDLQAIRLSGAADISVDTVDTARFELDLSGVGVVDVANLRADQVEMNFSGDGAVSLTGEAADQSISISGAGAYQAGELQSETARVRVSGAGSAELWVTEALDIDISGLGGVSYYGSPSVTQSITGLGGVEALGEK